MTGELPLPPIPEPGDREALVTAVFCGDCHRPVSSAAARRTGLGGGCRRKHRRGAIRHGRFTIDQEPLPGTLP